MNYSFIISSVDKYDDLQDCIASIENAYDFANKNIDIEILVVFKGEDNNRIKSVPVRYKNLTTFFTFKGVGLSEARNIGARESGGEYLIFVDDDATVKKNILEILSETVSSNDANAFGCRIMDPRDNSPFAVCYADNSKRELGWYDFNLFRGSAIIIRKAVLERIGFFDERFGPGVKDYAAEDSDIFFRLKQSKEKIIYIPDLVIYHFIPEPTRSRVNSYSYAMGGMLTKQIIADKKHFYIYLKIISEIVIKNFVRMIQCSMFRNTMAAKNNKYHYGSVFKGVIRGIYDYTKSYVLMEKFG